MICAVCTIAETHSLSAIFHEVKREPALAHVWPQWRRGGEPERYIKARSKERRFEWDDEYKEWLPLAIGYGYLHNYIGLKKGVLQAFYLFDPDWVMELIREHFGIRCPLCGVVSYVSDRDVTVQARRWIHDMPYLFHRTRLVCDPCTESILKKLYKLYYKDKTAARVKATTATAEAAANKLLYGRRTQCQTGPLPKS